MSALQQEFDRPLLGCALCKRAIQDGEPVFEEQTGWAARRKRGGLNALVARRSTGKVACYGCVNRLKRDIHPEQLTIE